MGAQVTKCMGPSGSKSKENIATVRSSTLTEDKIYVDCETRVFYTCLKDIDKKAYSLLEVKIRGIVAQAVATLGYFAVTNSYINTAIAEHIKIVLGALNDSENHERGMQITDIHFVAEAVDRSTRDLNHMRAVNVDATDSDNLTQAKSALRVLRIQNGMASMSSGERADILELFELLLSRSSQPRQVESLMTRFLDGESRRHQVALGGRGRLVAGGESSLVGGVDGRVSGLVDGGGSGRLAGGGRGLIAAGGSRLVDEGRSGLVAAGRSGLVAAGRSGLVDGGVSGLVVGGENGLVDGGASALVAAGLSGLVTGEKSGLVDGGGSGLVAGGESGLVDGGGSGLVAAEGSGLVTGGGSGLVDGGGSGFVAAGERGLVDGGGSGLVAAGGSAMDPAAHSIVYERLAALNSVLRNINGDPSVVQEVISQPGFTISGEGVVDARGTGLELDPGTFQLLVENEDRLVALYSELGNIHTDPSVVQEVIPQPGFTISGEGVVDARGTGLELDPGTFQLLVENQEKLAALYSVLRNKESEPGIYLEFEELDPQQGSWILENAELVKNSKNLICSHQKTSVDEVLDPTILPVTRKLLRELFPSADFLCNEHFCDVNCNVVSSSGDHSLPVDSDEDSVDLR